MSSIQRQSGSVPRGADEYQSEQRDAKKRRTESGTLEEYKSKQENDDDVRINDVSDPDACIVYVGFLRARLPYKWTDAAAVPDYRSSRPIDLEALSQAITSLEMLTNEQPLEPQQKRREVSDRELRNSSPAKRHKDVCHYDKNGNVIEKEVTETGNLKFNATNPRMSIAAVADARYAEDLTAFPPWQPNWPSSAAGDRSDGNTSTVRFSPSPEPKQKKVRTGSSGQKLRAQQSRCPLARRSPAQQRQYQLLHQLLHQQNPHQHQHQHQHGRQNGHQDGHWQ